MTLTRNLCTLATLIAILCAGSFAYAQNNNGWQKRKLWGYTISEHVLRPHVLLTPSEFGYRDNTDPAKAAQTFFSAVWNDDYETWFSLWTEQDKKEILEENAEKGWDEANWKQNWKEVRSKNRLQFNGFAYFQGYFMVGYELLNRADEITLRSAIVFKEMPDGTYLATKALNRHQVFVAWTELSR
jgi:hypothetical protein